jgi:NAD(P)-dependent dehydrogenase (short-subunit alcohol dehydrogenase family)
MIGGNGARPVAVVTGGGRGIGAAVCRRLAGIGHPVVVNYLGDRGAAERVVAEIEGAGGTAVAVPADVADEAAVLRLFDAAVELGTVGLVVVNAGITGPYGRLDELDAAALRRVVDVNVTGAVLCAREAVRRMSTRHGGAGGSVVTVSSGAAVLGSAGEWVHYAATKGAVNSLTVGLAREVATEGVRVNAVSPGLIETDLHATAGQPDRLARMAPTVPMGRPGTAAEVAEAVIWLASDAASFITGAVLPVTGGR